MKTILYIYTILLLSIILNNNAISNPNDFDGMMKALSTSLKSTYSNKYNKVQRLAVMPFVNEGGKRSHLGIYVSNALQEFIFDSSKFDLLERERIDSLLQEHEFNSSGLVSSLTTKKLGNLLGADIVLIGTISLDHKTFKINRISSKLMG